MEIHHYQNWLQKMSELITQPQGLSLQPPKIQFFLIPNFCQPREINYN